MKKIVVYALILAMFVSSAFCHLYDKAEESKHARGVAVQVAAHETTPPTTTTTTEKQPQTVAVIATAYCACEKCCGEWALNRPNGIVYTASGAEAKADHTIAVDTDVFPFGTVLEIGGIEYVAEDTGSAIVGNKIDIYFDSHETALEFGRQELTATIKD